MKAIFFRDINRFLSVKLLFLAVVCALVSLSERKDFSYSYDNFVLSMISNHYYLTFFMALMFFYMVYHQLEDDMDYVLIRISSYARYFAIKAAAMTVNMSIFVLIQLLVILVIGIGLPAGPAFPIPDPADPSLIVLQLFSEYFRYPWQATVVSVIYMILGLSVLANVFLTLHHFFEKRKVALMTISLYALMIIGMKSKIQGLTRIPFFFINNYIIFMYNLNYPYALQISFISLAIMIAVIVFFIRKYWNKRPVWNLRLSLPRGITFYYLTRLYASRNLIVLVFIVCLFCLWKLIQLRSMPNSTVEDYLLYVFWGHGHGYFQAMDFTMMILIHTLPIYLLAMFLENEKRDHNMMLTIRLRSKRHWAVSIVNTCVMFLFGYVLLLAGASLLIASFANLPSGGITFIANVDRSVIEILFYSAGMRMLDLLVQFLILFVVFLFTRQAVAGYVSVLMMFGLYLLPFSWVRYVPVGMSSLAQHASFSVESNQSLSGSFIAMMLTGLAAIWTFYVLLAGFKKRFN
ncbi:hypothetical protein SAMN05444162_0639 [Paenibacillaceae bacterium GAS479]|nr:hypothetical protein SAMN05444162_0639 [Paenibacillaceae bacterium GAS479]